MKCGSIPVIAVFLMLCSTAQAGQLFPPANVGAATECANGMVLKWSGNSVVCEDPSPGVNVAPCAAGKVMTGVNHGVPVCVTPAVTPTPLTVSCPSGQVLTGLSNGSPVCTTPSAAAVTVTCPSGSVLSGINNGTPVCENNNGAFGGTYGIGMGGHTIYKNPLTGARSCPTGYHAVQTSHGTNSCDGCVWYTCYKD